MRSKRLYTCISVLVVSTFACTLFSRPEPTPTPMPAVVTEAPLPTPVLTDTAQPPTATPTKEAPATPTPTTQQSVAPVIDSVDLEEQSSGGDMTVYQIIHFHDADGDVNYVDYEIVSATVDDVSVSGGSVDVPPGNQKRGHSVTGTWDCGSGSYEVTLQAILRDKAGNQSEPVEYTIICGRGAITGGVFPDTFDDNGNGWGLDNYFSIEGGVMKARNIPTDQSRWLWCDACQVTADRSHVSLDGSWADRRDASLGLLIDSGSCNPDGLVFLIGPHGYYSIFQAVRDDDGEWRHWRPYVDWVRSSLIRTGQNTANEISADYEFTDELRVSLYINGTYVTRVRVYGYNGSEACMPGLYVDGGLEADFDNFNISDK